MRELFAEIFTRHFLSEDITLVSILAQKLRAVMYNVKRTPGVKKARKIESLNTIEFNQTVDHLNSAAHTTFMDSQIKLRPDLQQSLAPFCDPIKAESPKGNQSSLRL